MHRIVVLSLILVVLGFTQPPMFHDYTYVTASGSPIVVSSHANPCVLDWDDDGLKDLLLGEFTQGRIRFYQNSGTNNAPVFTTFTYLRADGATIQLPYG